MNNLYKFILKQICLIYDSLKSNLYKTLILKHFESLEAIK